MKKVILFIVLVINLYNYCCVAQSGLFDETFNTIDKGFSVNQPANIFCVAVQTDGKIIIGGDFKSSHGNYLIRLNSDGSIDTTFIMGKGPSSIVKLIDIQTNGKIIVGGFNKYDDKSVGGLVRLNSDGTIDNSFNVGAGGGDYTNCCKILNDGRILVGGAFDHFNNKVSNGLVRLNQDGTIDETFNFTNNSIPRSIKLIQLQIDGKILIGGNFSANYNNVEHYGLLRLEKDGMLDVSFNTGTGIGTNSLINCISITKENKILIGGHFTLFNGYPCNNIVRLNSDGTFDNSFLTGNGAGGDVYTICTQNDGKIIVGGSFHSFDIYERRDLARLNSDGSVNESFFPKGGDYCTIYCTFVLQNGKILVGGYCNSINDIPCNGFNRLLEDGSIDNDFNFYNGFNSTVNKILITKENEILSIGNFSTYNGKLSEKVLKLNKDGEKDIHFKPKLGKDDQIETICLQNDGKILLGGKLTKLDGNSIQNLVRLDKNGNYDNTFNPGFEFTSRVYLIAFQNDGKIIVGTSNYLERLNSNGTLDNSFNIDFNILELNSIGFQSDGKIILSGSFAKSSGSYPKYYDIIRINFNGKYDESFNDYGFGSLANYGRVIDISIQNDDKIIAVGNFEYYNSTKRNGIVRINKDGELDYSFYPGWGVYKEKIYSVKVLPDGKIIIGGDFTTYNQIDAKYIARLNSNGSLDITFNNADQLNPLVKAIAIQNDGNLIIGGDFLGKKKNRMGRLLNSVNPPNIFKVTGGGSSCKGGEGVEIGLNGSQIGVSYHLKVNGNDILPYIEGSGNPISFGKQTIEGEYTVVAYYILTQIFSNMAGSASVNTLNLPIAYQITGGGNYCSGGEGVEIGLNGSQLGVSYVLKMDGNNITELIAGTGSNLSFGVFKDEGIYTVLGINDTTSCEKYMEGNTSIEAVIIDTSISIITSTLNSNEHNALYQWLDCNDNYKIIDGATHKYFIPEKDGSYAVEITKDGCIDTSSCHKVIITGIIENTFGDKLKVYPNPTNGKINIEFEEELNDVEITVSDLKSKEIYRNAWKRMSSTILELDKPAGTYIIQIASGKDHAIVRVVKQR